MGTGLHPGVSRDGSLAGSGSLPMGLAVNLDFHCTYLSIALPYLISTSIEVVLIQCSSIVNCLICLIF